MSFLNKLKFFTKNSNNFTLITGGHQMYTQNIVSHVCGLNKNIKFLVLNKLYESGDDIAIKEAYSKISNNVEVFNCNLDIQEDFDELLFFLNSKQIKVCFNNLDKRFNSFRSLYDLFGSFLCTSLS